jgi:hypothetical protein
MLGVSLTEQGLFLLAAMIVSARRTVHTKSVFRDGICLYGLSILGAVLFGIVIPGILVGLGADDEIANAFPEAIGVPPVAAQQSTGLRMLTDQTNVPEAKDNEAVKKGRKDCLCPRERFSCQIRLAGGCQRWTSWYDGG